VAALRVRTTRAAPTVDRRATQAHAAEVIKQ
jgi:hypothetical protein